MILTNWHRIKVRITYSDTFYTYEITKHVDGCIIISDNNVVSVSTFLITTSQESSREKINKIIEGLQTSLESTEQGVQKFSIQKGFVWKLFKAGKQLSELTDLNVEIKAKFQELKDWFVVSIETELSDVDLDKMKAMMETALKRVTQFPLEKAVNHGLNGANTDTEEGQAQAMKASAGSIVEAGVPADHMTKELGLIKDILERVEGKVDKLLDNSVFMLVIVRLPVRTTVLRILMAPPDCLC